MYQTIHASAQSHPSMSSAAEAAILDRISNCIQRGCFVCIEHAEAVKPHLTRWKAWRKPSCFEGDLGALYDSLEDCRRAHQDHHIRLSVENLSWRSRLSVVVHRPH